MPVEFPSVPGEEVAGVVDEVAAAAETAGRSVDRLRYRRAQVSFAVNQSCPPSRQPHEVEGCKRPARGLLQASPGHKVTKIDREQPGGFK